MKLSLSFFSVFRPEHPVGGRAKRRVLSKLERANVPIIHPYPDRVRAERGKHEYNRQKELDENRKRRGEETNREVQRRRDSVLVPFTSWA